MELNNKIFSKLLSLVDEAKKNKTYELEARFAGKHSYKKKIIINEENYNKIFQKLTFSKENNGMGYKYEMKNILDIILDKSSINNDYESIRMSINSLDNIKKYWLDSSDESLNTTFIEKERIDKIDEENYNIRFSLNNELPQNNLLNKNKNLIYSSDVEKVYRLKNRYSIKTDDNLFTIDMSSVKMGKGNTFKESNTLKEVQSYEIEIEYTGKDIIIENDIIVKNLLQHCNIILKLLQNNDILLKNSLINAVKNNYKKLTNNENKHDTFIAANPVTIHKEHLIKSDILKNIYGRYAATLKADGERNFLIVHSSENKDDNGKIFIFNNNFNFIDTGCKDLEWIDTLVECEFVVDNNEKEIYMYDILFCKGEDVRKRYLINLQKDSKIPARLELLNKFSKSKSRVIDNEKYIILKEKQYKYSTRADGTDIFQKIKDIWDTRKYNSFNVDGIILVPIFEYYKMGGGAWHSLFKWKPPNLNTVDFLIKVVKDDNKKDIKNPYIEIIDRLDDKRETLLKQYKIIKLMVTGQKAIYNNTNQRTFIKVPELFNPFKTDESNSEIYNTVKIFIEDDEKIFAIDPITNEKVEIYDDIIVEFGYDDTKEEGFKWIPYRFRKDKTEAYKNGQPMFGNSVLTANDIFKAINNPITEEMITTGIVTINQNQLNKDASLPYYAHLGNEADRKNRLQYRNFHNHYIKYQLLYFSSPSYINGYVSGSHGKLLDLCCGKGVDINKIKRARYAEIVGMDIDYDGVKFAEEFWRTRMKTPKPLAFYIHGDSSKLIWPEQACAFSEADKIKIRKYIPSKYIFDTISLQFCLHYFFENEITCRTIIQNITDNLKIGGFVIGTTFDGERIYNNLKNTGSIMGKMDSGDVMWKIDKKYSTTKLAFTDKKPNFGKEIDVYIQSIGQVHKEFLVNFTYLDKIMEEYGFSKIYVKPFEDFYNELKEGKSIMDLDQKEFYKDVEVINSMSEDEKRLSFLSSGFIYKKIKNSSDSLLKKLLDMMEKKHKLKKKDVYKVNADTEHTIEDMGEDMGE